MRLSFNKIVFVLVGSVLSLFLVGVLYRGHLFYSLARANGLLSESAVYSGVNVATFIDEQIKAGNFTNQYLGVVEEDLEPDRKKRYSVIGIKNENLTLLDVEGVSEEFDLRRAQNRSLFISENFVGGGVASSKLKRMLGVGTVQEVTQSDTRFWAGVVNLRSEDILDFLVPGSIVEITEGDNDGVSVISSFVVIYLPANIVYEVLH